ncbi:MAG: hypothetical protein CVV64_14590 [Candidatus Wallbacteria bacterium HGW-Wallbacteria-1]|uniref:Uncharacterized protein n=1 Tax=Candidatus Wallbacteria bacterium HGW-Wallbacteria-1 TaxID=2013854 RepID=A0A2N1PLZ7_9BACT|nr:MAG: hypothetical protein CVV64_14590 [Candidatus Wallbacteria bacterium HGW-Wallbacteria-1]
MSFSIVEYFIIPPCVSLKSRCSCPIIASDGFNPPKKQTIITFDYHIQISLYESLFLRIVFNSKIILSQTDPPFKIYTDQYYSFDLS